VKAYFTVAGSASFLPAGRREMEVLLTAFLLDKAFYELKYEINNRPAWVAIPLAGIVSLIKDLKQRKE